MDKCTHEVRATQWREIIQKCHQRPAGQSAKQWLKDHGILEQSYYYWLRKLRAETFNNMKVIELPVTQEHTTNEVSFAEIEISKINETPKVPPTNTSMDFIIPAAVIKSDTVSVAISNDISESLLKMILQEVSHA